MARYKQEMNKQNTERKAAELKLQLVRALNRYQQGAISPAEYKRIESEILKAFEAH